MTDKKRTELLSPAGTWEALVAAVQSGADAVYIGGVDFSARAGASNFDTEGIISAVKYCHVRGVKVFITLNILIKQSEFEKAVDFAGFLYESGVDGIIIQDLGLAVYIKDVFSDMRLHASTQMSVHSISGAKALEKLGFERVVVARELSAKQIFEIKQQTNLEIEMFVHGAICQSYSGQCLFSSFLGERSGNRGRCAQPCRLSYTLKNGDKTIKKGYLLSPKDMCLISHMKEIKNAGIDSLKIEGRLKKPEYVASVTKIYRKYLDEPRTVSKEDMDALFNAFNRSGFTDGYFTEKTGANMMSYNSPSNVSKEKFDKDIKKYFVGNANLKQIDVYAQCVIKKGERMSMTLKDNDNNEVMVYGAEAAALSDNNGLDYKRVYTQLSKFGSVPFNLKKLSLDYDEGVYVSISDINALRRSACDALIKKREKAERHIQNRAFPKYFYETKPNDDKEHINAEVLTYEQAKALIDCGIERLFVPYDVAQKLSGKCKNTNIVLKTDSIINNENEYIYDLIEDKEVMCSSLGAGMRLCASNKVYGDYRLNVYNSYTAYAYLKNGFSRVTLSPELSIKDIEKIDREIVSASNVVVYGHTALMVMKNCVIKSCTGRCMKGEDGFVLCDRMGEEMPLLCRPFSCTNLLLNSKPIYMADKIGDLKKAGVKHFMLLFSTESGSECARVYREYLRAVNGEKVENSMGINNFTRGHFYRRVQ